MTDTCSTPHNRLAIQFKTFRHEGRRRPIHRQNKWQGNRLLAGFQYSGPMLYSPDFEQAAIDQEQNAYDALIAWLSGQPPEVWLWFAGTGNWDTCIPVFTWMVEQPTCDAAVIAALFWEANPTNLAERTIAGERRPAEWDSDELVQLILLTWRSRPPWDDGFRVSVANPSQAYRQRVASAWGGADPLAVPEWLFGPFGTLEAQSLSASIASDEQLRNVFLELGMWYGDAPPAEAHWQKTNEPAAMTPAERRLQIKVGLALISPSILLGGWYLYKWWAAL